MDKQKNPRVAEQVMADKNRVGGMLRLITVNQNFQLVFNLRGCVHRCDWLLPLIAFKTPCSTTVPCLDKQCPKLTVIYESILNCGENCKFLTVLSSIYG